MDSDTAVSSDLYLIGKGRISGTYCDSFWKINSEGKTGYQCFRYPFAEEIPKMLSDIAKHREQLLKELDDLSKAEDLLRRAQTDENYRTKNPDPIGTLEIASNEIYNKYIGTNWFQAIGIGKDELIIYTNTKKVPVSFDIYNGFPVKFKYIGKIKPS